jgi:hypothetical protein
MDNGDWVVLEPTRPAEKGSKKRAGAGQAKKLGYF